MRRVEQYSIFAASSLRLRLALEYSTYYTRKTRENVISLLTNLKYFTSDL